MEPVINVKPTSITVELGETAQVQIDTNVPNFDVVNHNEGVCYFDKKHLEVKGLSTGYNQIDLIVESGGVVAKASIAVTVVDAKSSSKIRYMLHNRNTNRLVTGIVNKMNETNLTFWLGLTRDDKGEIVTDGIPIGSIATPVILNPNRDTNDFKGTIKVSDFQTLMGVNDLKHTHTEWQIATDRNFLHIVNTEFKYKYKLTEYGVKYLGKKYYYRVRYYSNDNVSPWSEPRSIIGTDLGPDRLTTFIAGDYDKSYYYGEIPYSELIEDYDYRGNYFTLISNNIINFKVGQVVSHNGQLWRCIKDYRVDVSNGFSRAIHPGHNNPEYMYSPFILLPYCRQATRGRMCKFSFKTRDNVVSITPVINDNIANKTWDDKGKLYKEDDDTYTYIFKSHALNNYAFTMNIVMQQPITKMEYKITMKWHITNSLNQRPDVRDNMFIPEYIDTPTDLDAENMDIKILNNENKVVTFQVQKSTATIDNNANNIYDISFFMSDKHLVVPDTVYPTINWTTAGDNYRINSGSKTSSVTTTRNGYIVASYGAAIPKDNDVWYYHAMTISRVSGYDNTEDNWVLEDRSNLPTVSWLMDRIGIGFGVTDKNLDKLTFGSINIGEMINKNEGWLKLSIDNRVLYVYKKPICNTISWMDIARRDAVYGNRTIRIGNRLYYIRLLTERDYKECLLSGVSGYSAEELGLGDYEFIEDFQEGMKRKTINANGEIVEVDPKNRIGKYRPVLELIPEGNEPYNNLPKMPPAENEFFQYDPVTDTGYFGEVLSSNFTNGKELCDIVKFNLSEGTLINSDAGWLKFYWHGLFFLISKKGLRQNISFNSMYSKSLIHYKDTGNNSKVCLEQNGVTYALGLIDIHRTEPFKFDPSFQGYRENIANIWNMPVNIHLEVGKFTKWNELIYRVIKCYASGQSTEAKYWNSYHFYYTINHTGLQIGDNWAEYDPVTLMCRSWNQRGAGFMGTTVYDYFGNYMLSGNGKWGKDNFTSGSSLENTPSNDVTNYIGSNFYQQNKTWYTDNNWGPIVYIQKDSSKFANNNLTKLEDKNWDKYPNIILSNETKRLMPFIKIKSRDEIKTLLN